MPHSVHQSTSTIMSRVSSSSTSSANQFPRQAGATLVVPEGRGDQLSPSRSTFSFDDSPKSGHGSDRAVAFDETRILRPASRSALNEIRDVDSPLPRQQNFGARRRTQYFEDSFAYKDSATSSARDRVTRDAPIMVDLQTNVIVCSLPSCTALVAEHH